MKEGELADRPILSTKIVGSAGEIHAVQFLEKSGYRIVDVNVRPIGGRSRGEIDIVAWHGDVLVFVEVKTRRLSAHAATTPGEAVDPRKRRQILKLAQAYLILHNLDEVPCRFDVVEVVNRGGKLEFNLIENAFDGNDV